MTFVGADLMDIYLYRARFEEYLRLAWLPVLDHIRDDLRNFVWVGPDAEPARAEVLAAIEGPFAEFIADARRALDILDTAYRLQHEASHH